MKNLLNLKKKWDFEKKLKKIKIDLKKKSKNWSR